uniref:Uncharacterized protein n=1 Tax=Chaetoceros debilis TaxID=122233 RepID=A0A6S8WVH9_9STRA
MDEDDNDEQYEKNGDEGERESPPNEPGTNDDDDDNDNDGGDENEAQSDDEMEDYVFKVAQVEEETEMVKAREGYELVETITGQDRRRVKVIYLTNKQAAHLAEDSTAMGRMITSLCGGTKRYLVIDLVQSWGFYNSTKIMERKKYKNTKENKWNAGITYNTPPFKDLKEEQETINQINHFMLNGIIPLAEKTSAIVVCNAVPRDCILCERFISIVESKSSRWGGDPPFAVVGILESVHVLYHNNVDTAT